MSDSGERAGLALSVVVPMYNEQETVANTVREVSEVLAPLEEPWEIVLVNDGSLDRTAEIAAEIAQGSEGVRLVSYGANAGRGKALRTGFEHARGDIVVSIDCDLSYDASHILKLYNELRSHPEIDVVLGSPYMKGGKTVGVPWFRLLVSRIGNLVVGYALGGSIKTVTGVLRAYRRPVLQSIELASDGKEIHLEILEKLLAVGCRVREVPATLRGRREGRSKFQFRSTSVSHLVFSVSERPMMAFGLLGFLLIALGLVGGIYIVVLWRQAALNPDRPLMTLLVLLILAGVQLLSFGFIAIQIGTLRKEIYKVQRENRLLKRSLDVREETLSGTEESC